MVYFCLENFSPSNIEEEQNPIIPRETEIEKQSENRIIPQNDYVETVSEIPKTRKYNIDLVGGDIFDDTPDKKINAFKVKVTNTGLQMLEDDMKKKKIPELGNRNYRLGNRGVTGNVLQNSFIKQNVDFKKKSSNYDYSEIIANDNRMKATEHDSNVLQYYETNTKIDHVKDLDENDAMIILPVPNVMELDSKRIFVPRSEISTNNQRFENLHLNSDFANRGMEGLESLETQNEDNNNNDLIDHSYFSEDNHSPQKENRAFIEPPSIVETYNTQMEKPGLDMHLVPLNLGVQIKDLENPVGQIFVVKDIKNQRTGKKDNYPKHFSDNDQMNSQNRGLLYLETQKINESKDYLEEPGTDNVEQGLTNPELQSEPSNVEQQVSVTRPPFKQIEHTKLFNDLEKFIETKGLGNSEENMRRVIYATENLYDSIEVGVDDKPNKSRISQRKEEEEPDKKALKNDKMLNENIDATEDNASEIEKDTGHLNEEDRNLEKP